MKPFILILALATMSAAAALSEEKPPHKPLDESFLRLYAETRGFLLGRPVKPKFTPDAKHVLFLRGGPKSGRLSLFEFDVATGKTRELLSPDAVLKGAEENLSPEEKSRRERMRLTAGGFADFHISEDGVYILLPLSGKLYLLDRKSEKVRELKTGKGTLIDPKFSPDSKKVSYVLDYDIYVYDLEKDKESAVTKDGTAGKTHGLAEFVAQEEMGRMTGYWWSPDSKEIAFEEADYTGVEIWYVADPTKPGQKPIAQYYPRPGKKNATTRLGVVTVDGGKTQWITYPEEHYLTRVYWTELGLYREIQPRDQHLVEGMVKYFPIGSLFTQDMAPGIAGKWVDLDQTFFQKAPKQAVRGSCLDDPDPTQPRPPGIGSRVLKLGRLGDFARGRAGLFGQEFPRAVCLMDKFLKYDYDNDTLYGLTGSDPTQKQLAQVDLNGKPVQQKLLTVSPGMHSAVFSEDCSHLALTFTSLEQMPRTTVFTSAMNNVGELPSVAVEPDFKLNMTVQKVGEGDGYYTAIVRPLNFDTRKKYPVVVNVYGGPRHQTVLQSMRPWLLMQWLADQGFIVVGIDGRGTPGRSAAWEQAIYQKFGSIPLEDQVAGLQALGKKFPEMDMSRVGIVGWSFGGYMSALAVLDRPDLFKAAVAGAPVTDWEDYDTHYTERYMGLLPESKKAYEEASLLLRAPKLTRPLLLVHGTVDDNVYFRHTLRLVDALFRAGKEFEVLPLPGLTHMVPDPVVTEQLWTRTARHFQKHLGTPTEQ